MKRSDELLAEAQRYARRSQYWLLASLILSGIAAGVSLALVILK